MNKREKIMERLQSDYNLVTSMGYEVLGVFLQGSQNYNLDYEGSDIDTKAIVIPTFEDFCFGRQPVSTTHVLPSDEHVDIKDIRLMHECFRKQNINFIEILFTEYKILNSMYEDIYQPMFDNNERIARFNNYAAVNCMVGMIYEKYKALEHPYPATKDKIEQYGYDNKQLHHIIRVTEFLVRYIRGVSYKDCLFPLYPDKLREIKAEYIIPLETARLIAAEYNYTAKLIKDKYMEDYPIKIDNGAKEIMDKVLIEVLKTSFKEQIKD